MRLVLLLLGCVAWQICTARGGTLEGTVQAKSRDEGTATTASAYESRKLKFAEKIDYSQYKDFVVYVVGPLKEKPEPPKKPVQVITQKDAQFTPHVLPILVGTTVEWPNRDDILHNVFSISDPKLFDLGLYKDGMPRVTFDKSGKVDVFCSIHTKMHCVILVLETPYFAVSNAKNRYAIQNVPPGKYTVRAWHERLPVDEKEVVIPPDSKEPVRLDFVLTVKGLPKY